MPVTGADACRGRAPTAWPAAADRNDVIGELRRAPAVPPIIGLRCLRGPSLVLALRPQLGALSKSKGCYFTVIMDPADF